jgi:hypothetical protein
MINNIVNERKEDYVETKDKLSLKGKSKKTPKSSNLYFIDMLSGSEDEEEKKQKKESGNKYKMDITVAASTFSNQFVETFNPNILRNIIKHDNYYAKFFENSDSNESLMYRINSSLGDCSSYSPFTLAEKYLNSASGEFGDKVIVKYERKYNRGRRFACNALSLQSLPKLIRGSIAAEFYYDVDMVNCHPTIIKQLFEKHKISMPFLSNYITDRADIIKEICNANPSIHEPQVKECILSVLYAGNASFNSIKKPTDWMKGYKKEIEKIHKQVPELFSQEFELQKKIKGENYFNLAGSTLSAVICVIEDKILDIMLNYFIDTNVVTDDVVLCFDGIMIRKDKLSTTKIDKHLQKIKKLIFEQEKYIMDFKIKDFYVLPRDVPEEYEIKEEDLGLTDAKDLYRKTDYYWYDFIKELDAVHSSFTELKKTFTTGIKKCMMRVYEMDEMLIKKIDMKNLFHFEKKVPIENIKYRDVNGKKRKIVSITFKKLLTGTTGWLMDIPVYNKLDFRPFGPMEDYKEDERAFNTWTGFKAQLLPESEVDVSKIEMILNHIKKVWCSDNEEYYRYILSWFKLVFTNPSFKSKIALVLKSSEKQIGKGILLNEFLIPLVFGEQYAMSVAGLDTITAKFNQIMMNKLLINCDELSTLDGGYHQSFDVLKKLITDNTTKIEIKGGKSFIYPDYCNYIMCTNNDFTIKIEPGDARYFILECSPCYKNNFIYFNQLKNTFTEETADHFFSYISYFSDNVEIRNIPATQLKKDMMIMGLQSPIRFLMDLKEKNDNEDKDDQDPLSSTTEAELPRSEERKDEEDDEEENDVLATTLYSMYKDWCSSCNEKVVSSTKFGREIKNFIQKRRTNSGFRYIIESINLSSLGL